MNEEKNLQELFQKIESGVSASEPLKGRVQAHLASRRKPLFRRRLSWAGAFAVATVFVWGALLLTPTSSIAAKMKRIELAMQGKKSMRIRSYQETKDAPRHLFCEMVLANGAWRSDVLVGTPLARTYIRQNGEQWLYLACSDVSVGGPAVENPIDAIPTALELAKAISDEGEVSTPRDLKVVPHADERGHRTYAITGTRPGTDYKLELVIDKATDLPIRSTVSETPFNRGTITEEYAYDVPVTASTFDPKIKPSTKVLMASAEVARLKQEWAKSLGRSTSGAHHMDVRDISVNGQGDVFVVCSYDYDYKKQIEPQLLPRELTDDLGRQYEEVTALNPGGTFGPDANERDALVFNGDMVKIVEFAPVLPKSVWPPAKSFTIRAAQVLEGSITPPPPTTTEITLTAPAIMPTQFPAYSDSLFLGYEHIRFEMAASEERARNLEKSGDFAQAAHWYRDAALHAPTPGYRIRDEESASHCLGRAGKLP